MLALHDPLDERIDTPAGSILCDPWVNPAYFASWFPFPDNSTLDWDTLGDCDYLYVSHLHKDHFDPKNLTVKAGETFYEPGGSLHRVSKNPGKVNFGSSGVGALAGGAPSAAMLAIVPPSIVSSPLRLSTSAALLGASLPFSR